MTEVERIADQFKRVIEGDAWYGSSFFEILLNVDNVIANSRPLDKVHSIHEILKHVTAWNNVVVKRIMGKTITLNDEEDWPKIKDSSLEVWEETLIEFRLSCTKLYNAMLEFPEENLKNIYTENNINYTFYFMLHGIIQHNIYHAAQIAIFKKQLI